MILLMAQFSFDMKGLRRNFSAVKQFLLAILCLAAAASARATTWYVDGKATGANNGTSWANAWTSVSGISGVGAGDTVYISGGPSGQSQTYILNSTWTPVGGNPGSLITYQIGQDPAHNGIAVFDCSAAGTWLGRANNITVSGNAGDGQMHFSLSRASFVAYLPNTVNVTISYINMGQVTEGNGGGTGVIDANPVNGLQIDHCWCMIVDPNADHFSYCLFQGNGYDQSRAFNNTIYIPRGQYAFGADCFQWNGSGFSIYNNTVIAYVTNYAGGQHQDGVQPTSGSYVKIYNNTFRDCGNASIFLDGYWGNFVNVMVYNNLMFMSTPVSGAFYPRGLDIISDHAAVAGPILFQNVYILNNIAVNYPTLYGMSFYAPPTGVGSTYINCVMADNICYNTGTGFNIDSASGLTFVNNKSVSGAGGSFVYYVPLTSANATTPYDFHLSASDTLFRGQGGNYYQYITTDKDGNPRPPSGAWDMGPYQYGAGAGVNTNPLPPVVTAISQNATDVDPNVAGSQVYEGTIVQYSASASDPNGNALTWNWVYTVNGGPEITYQSGSGTVLPINFTYSTGTAGNTYVWTLRVSDEQFTSQSQFTTSVEVPPQVGQGLAFLAASGTITTPFATNNGAVSQSVQTTSVANSGRAAYSFSITNAGYYVVQALVNAPSDAANSMYVNIDAEPVDPAMIWDMTITAGFEQRLVSWRGLGTDANNQYVPEFFNLTQGTHQIIFRGREANVQLQSFNILKVPQPPQGLQVVAGP